MAMFRSKPALPDPVSHGGRTVVVGAGASGLAAAKKLIGAGYDVEVVEARDRIGGRAHAEIVDGVTLDSGLTYWNAMA